LIAPKDRLQQKNSSGSQDEDQKAGDVVHTALSYVWGDPTDRIAISVKERSFK
jgi:hypothetical protein